MGNILTIDCMHNQKPPHVSLIVRNSGYALNSFVYVMRKEDVIMSSQNGTQSCVYTNLMMCFRPQMDSSGRKSSDIMNITLGLVVAVRNTCNMASSSTIVHEVDHILRPFTLIYVTYSSRTRIKNGSEETFLATVSQSICHLRTNLLVIPNRLLQHRMVDVACMQQQQANCSNHQATTLYEA